MKACVFCGRAVMPKVSLSFLLSLRALEPVYLCGKCAGKFQEIDSKTACQGCSRAQTKQQFCSDCERWRRLYPHLSLQHHAIFRYNNIARAYMDQFKFQGDLVLAQVFKKELQFHLKKYTKSHQIVPIPLSKNSHNLRGFNQVEVLLQAAGISYKNYLVYTTNTANAQKQSSKSRSERLKMTQPFALTEEGAISLKKVQKPILLVDDVYTTGRTLLHGQAAILEGLKEEGQLQAENNNFSVKTFSLFR